MTAYQSIAVIAKKRDPQVRVALERVCASLRDQAVDVLVETEPPYDTDIPGIRRASRAELVAECALALVIGGDGSLLDVGRSMAPAGIPVLGINQGRLGFLADVHPDQIADTLAELLRGEALLEERLMLEVRLVGRDGSHSEPQLAVNDVVLRNLASIRMLEFETWQDDEFISSHRADGLIVATPTGSTAYALSCGGPVLHPALSTLALVPICPHTLSDRPIAVTAEQVVRIVLQGDARGAAVTCDGQIILPLDDGESVEVTRAPYSLRLLHPRSYSYFNLLREKLRWGRGPNDAVKRA